VWVTQHGARLASSLLAKRWLDGTFTRWVSKSNFQEFATCSFPNDPGLPGARAGLTSANVFTKPTKDCFLPIFRYDNDKEKPHLAPSINAGTSEPMGASPPEAVAYQVLVISFQERTGIPFFRFLEVGKLMLLVLKIKD
jgi:hypothetical protein